MKGLSYRRHLEIILEEMDKFRSTTFNSIEEQDAALTKLLSLNTDEGIIKACIKENANIICNHISKVVVDGDAHNILIINSEKTVDICCECFGSLIGNEIIKHDANLGYVFEGTIIEFQMHLERI